MRSVVSTRILAVGVAAFLALTGAVATAEAGRGGGGGHGGGHMSGGHMSGGHMSGGRMSGGHMSGGRMSSHAFKGGSGGRSHYSGGKSHYSGGGKYKGGKGQHYAHGGNWNKNYYSHHHSKYGRYRRGYPWYGVYAYGGGGCGWLYSRAITTGSAYWWNRYYQCAGY